MSSVTLARPAVRRNQNLYRQSATLRLGPVSATFVIVTMVSLLALLYLNQITKTSTFNYRAAELERQKAEVARVKVNLGNEAARLKSIQEIKNSTAVKKMVPETNVSYAD